MKFKKILTPVASLFLILGSFISGFQAKAATAFETANSNMGTASGFLGAEPDLPLLIARIVNLLLSFVGIILMLYFLYAGFLWMTSGGEEKKITKAKDILKTSVIGLFIILSSYIISQYVFVALASITTKPTS